MTGWIEYRWKGWWVAQMRRNLMVNLFQIIELQKELGMQPETQNKYKTLEQIGRGAYGVVYKAKNVNTNEIVAIKRMSIRQRQDEGVSSTNVRQPGILKSLNHENIIKLKDVNNHGEFIDLVFEYVESDLKKLMTQLSRLQKPLDPTNIKKLMFQLLKGIQHCQKHSILHRDLKPQNLLISKQGKLKIADFGLARGTGIPTKPFRSEVVTLWYRPPDLLLGHQNYQFEADIWSIGCIFAELHTLQPLFPGNNEQTQLNQIFKTMGTPSSQRHQFLTTLSNWKSYNFPNHSPRNLKDFIKIDERGLDLLKKMLQVDPKKRILAKQALSHAYFKDL